MCSVSEERVCHHNDTDIDYALYLLHIAGIHSETQLLWTKSKYLWWPGDYWNPQRMVCWCMYVLF